MKVQIEKDVLISALDKMHSVSTKALFPNFSLPGRVTVDVKSSGRTVFTSSNGCLTAQQEVDVNTGVEKGICTVDSTKLRDAVKRISTESPSSLLELSVTDDVLFIRDPGTKRKKVVKLPTEKTHHKINSVKKPKGDSFFFETTHLLRGFRTVSPFRVELKYNARYQVVFFHWTGKEARMVCGDGSIFAIFSSPRHTKNSNNREFKRSIPADQLAIVTGLLEDSAEIEMVWEGKSRCWMKTDSVELVLNGYSDTDYINYEANAYRFDEAKAYVDIKQSDLKEISELLVSLQDKEQRLDKCFSCYATFPSSDGNALFEIRANQGRYQCEYEVPIAYHNIEDKDKFFVCYAHLFFSSPVQVMQNEYLRLYLINEEGIAVARDVTLGNEDRDGIPMIQEEDDGCSLSFFFAAVEDEGDEEKE